MDTFKNIKIVIVNGRLTNDEVLERMDIFLLCKRISPEQYNELILMLEPGIGGIV